MGEPITREEIERWRAAFAEMLAEDRDDAPGDFARLLAAAEATLDHPAALEAARAEGGAAMKERAEACRYLENVVANAAPPTTKPLVGDLIGLCTQVDSLMCWVREQARAEERERCAQWHDAAAKRLRDVAAKTIVSSGYLRLADQHDSYAAAIRALGPAVEQPAPQAICLGCDGCGNITTATTIEKCPRCGGTGRAAAPPALPPDLRERVVKVLEPLAAGVPALVAENDATEVYEAIAEVVITVGDLRAAAALLSALRAPPEWLPTHQHEAGDVVRLLMRLTNGDVVVDDYNGGAQAIGRVGFAQWFRPLTPAEARAAMEAGRG